MGDHDNNLAATGRVERELDERDPRAVENERIDAFISDLAKRLAAQPPSARDWRRG